MPKVSSHAPGFDVEKRNHAVACARFATGRGSMSAAAGRADPSTATVSATALMTAGMRPLLPHRTVAGRAVRPLKGYLPINARYAALSATCTAASSRRAAEAVSASRAMPVQILPSKLSMLLMLASMG